MTNSLTETGGNYYHPYQKSPMFQTCINKKLESQNNTALVQFHIYEAFGVDNTEVVITGKQVYQRGLGGKLEQIDTKSSQLLPQQFYHSLAIKLQHCGKDLGLKDSSSVGYKKKKTYFQTKGQMISIKGQRN